MLRPNPVNKHNHCPAGGLEKLGPLLADTHPDLAISKRMRKVESIECVRLKRSRPAEFGLLVQTVRPLWPAGEDVRSWLSASRAQEWAVRAAGDRPPKLWPWGQDRLVPIFLATLAIRQQAPRITFDSAAERLDTFWMQQGGSQYRRLVAAFQRIFGANIFFGTDTQRERAAVVIAPDSTL